jgi:hypothetical protein
MVLSMRNLTGQDELDCTAGPGPTTRMVVLLSRLEAVAEPRTLPLHEWESALLDLRAALRGPRVEAHVVCAACGAGAMLAFDTTALPREETALPASPLPLHPLCAGDLADLEATGLIGQEGLVFLLARAARCTAADAEAALSGAGAEALFAALETLAGGLGIELTTDCPSCGAAVAAPFDVAAFVDAEMQAHARRLLDEVHLIASTYHWAEEAILAMPVERRQAYLSRILAARAVPELGPGDLAGAVGGSARLGAVA